MKIEGYEVKGIKDLCGRSKKLPEYPYVPSQTWYPYLVKTGKKEYTLYASIGGECAANDVIQIQSFNRPTTIAWLYSNIARTLKVYEQEGWLE